MDGPAVVQGTVETDGGAAIVVAITQRRSVHRDKQGREHTRWTELHREVVVSPFRIRLRDGRAVRVEPTRSVLLRDAIEAPEPIDETTRRRCVRLRPGEHAWVSGVLSGAAPQGTRSAYREGMSSAVVLRPPRLSRMIVSTEPPDYVQPKPNSNRSTGPGRRPSPSRLVGWVRSSTAPIGR